MTKSLFKCIINTKVKKAKINKNIYGHFAEHLGRCIYGGIYVGKDSDIPNINGIRKDIVEALKQIKIPVLRWPGGCFADEYHWKDGIGDPAKRPSMINTHWGGVVEDNSFGTHEFMELCELLGAEPYINGNVGSGTVQEMSEWVEYMTFDGESPMANLRRQNGREKPWKLKYFGIGNENWGCGGNMRPEYYSDLYRRFATYVKGPDIHKIACGANVDDYNWTDVVMKNAARHMQALTLHYYTIPGPSWADKGNALRFTEDEWVTTMKKTLRMNELLDKHITIMNKYDPEKRIDLIVDEWGTWFNVEAGTNPGFLYQQSSLRDALVAGINLNIFNNNADRVRMTNIAQMVNVLQSVILTEGDKMVKTPTYHVFDMYKVHQGADLLDLNILKNHKYNDMDSVNISASRDVNGKVNITLTNCNHLESVECELDIVGVTVSSAKGSIITHSKLDAHNNFHNTDEVTIVDFSDFKIENGVLKVKMPSKSVVAISI